MAQHGTLKSIETTLGQCRDMARSIGDDVLAYMIEIAIRQAEQGAEEAEQPVLQTNWRHASGSGQQPRARKSRTASSANGRLFTAVVDL
jgi:hypothetical protein